MILSGKSISPETNNCLIAEDISWDIECKYSGIYMDFKWNLAQQINDAIAKTAKDRGEIFISLS